MFFQGEQGRKAIDLAIMCKTVSYVFSTIYITLNFKLLTSWISCFWNLSNTKVEASRENLPGQNKVG